MFRFSIRDVLWLTVVVGILLLWAVERQGTHVVDYPNHCKQQFSAGTLVDCGASLWEALLCALGCRASCCHCCSSVAWRRIVSPPTCRSASPVGSSAPMDL